MTSLDEDENYNDDTNHNKSILSTLLLPDPQPAAMISLLLLRQHHLSFMA